MSGRPERSIWAVACFVLSVVMATVFLGPVVFCDSEDLPAYIERQHQQTLEAVESVLEQVKPAYPEPKERHLAMLALDEALHYGDPNSNASAAVRAFLTKRTETAALEMEKTDVRTGAVVWKLYNHAFVVSTASAAVAFDLTRGYWGRDGGYPELDAAAKRIIDKCDVLFLSHDHGDHLDGWVKDAFLSKGKPVIAPPDVFADDKRITRLARDGSISQKVTLSHGRELKVVVFPGYQGDLPNNVTLVTTPEGISFAHTGDLFQNNSTKEDMWQWIDHVKDHHHVDLLLVNVWVSNMSRVVKGFGPKMVITGHENELGHDPLKRKGNFVAYDVMSKIGRPWVLITWGEAYSYAATSPYATGG